MFFLCYISSAVKPFSRSELIEILTKSRVNNARLGITGILLYKEGNIIQILEGEESAVRSLYAKIARDPRHKDAIVLLQGHEDEKQFPEWSMGFRELVASEALDLPGFTDMLRSATSREGFSRNPSRCQKLLLSFKRTM
jgi:hypothetical protein